MPIRDSGLMWSIAGYPFIAAGAIGVSVHEDAIVSRSESGSIHWPRKPSRYQRGAVYDRHLVESSQRRGGAKTDLVVTANPPVLSQEERDAAVRHPGSWLYLGNWMDGFGHFILETLTTAWVDVRGFDGIVANRFLSRNQKPWQQELADLIGLHDVMVIDAVPGRFESLTVPDRSFHYQQEIHAEAVIPWRKVAAAEPSGRVYFSRSLVENARTYANSVAVEALFASIGFNVVHPETLPIAEQVRLATGAEIIAGPAGSALHLAAFAPRARVIELGDVRTPDRMVAAQAAISRANDQEVAFIPYTDDGDHGFRLASLDAALAELLGPPA
jgi:capsular polysaccharide biosynthesis protein